MEGPVRDKGDPDVVIGDGLDELLADSERWPVVSAVRDLEEAEYRTGATAWLVRSSPWW